MIPNPNQIFPREDVPDMTLVRPTITRPNIEVGEYTYFSGRDFEAHVTHHYPFYGDKLIIGKFCQIAAGVEFIMNGANHQMNALTTYPFYILGWEQNPPDMADLPNKGGVRAAPSVPAPLQGGHRGGKRRVDWTECHDSPRRPHRRRGHHRRVQCGGPGRGGLHHRGGEPRPDGPPPL